MHTELTRTLIEAEPAGRRLDAWLGLHVMGWAAVRNFRSATEHQPEAIDWMYEWVPPQFKGDVNHWAVLPRYSTDPALLTAIRDRLWELNPGQFHRWVSETVYVEPVCGVPVPVTVRCQHRHFTQDNGVTDHTQHGGYGDTESLALTRLALLWVLEL